MKERMADLNAELEELSVHRGVMRKQRERTGIPVISLVGYTNAGKSTLMNALSGAGVSAEDKFFTTLGATTREIKTPNGVTVLLSDTVGFIRKLPHTLINAFHATLEEVRLSDALLHVVDALNPDRERQMEIVYDTLKGLSCLSKPIITVFNKIDEPVEKPFPGDSFAREAVVASALSGEGIDRVLDAVERLIRTTRRRIAFFVPFSDGRAIAAIYKNCDVISEEANERGCRFDVCCDETIIGALKEYISDYNN
jgi:GTP-binding protein HflX